VMQSITNNSAGLTTDSLSLIQISLTNLFSQNDLLGSVQNNTEFQRNFFNVQSSSLNSVNKMEVDDNPE
jgi:hypothetical protein